MQTTSVTVGSATFSNWIPLNYLQKHFAVSLGVTLTPSATLTYQVQHTFDNPWATLVAKITRSTTTATLTYIDHGLRVGDSVVVTGAGAPFDGTFAVASVVDADNITYTVLNSGLLISTPGATFARLRVFAHEDLTALTADADGNYAFPVRACRLNITAYTDGKATLTVNQGL